MEPRSIEAVGPMAVVAHSEIGALTLVRGSTLAVEHVLRGFGEPRYTAGHPDGRHAYVTDAKRGEAFPRAVERERACDAGTEADHQPNGQLPTFALEEASAPSRAASKRAFQ